VFKLRGRVQESIMNQMNVSKLSSTKKPAHEVAVDEANPPKHRTWTAQQKLRVLKELEEIKLGGADVGAFLRRNALFSSTVSLWKKQRNNGELGSEGKKRGPKSKLTPEMIEIEKLKKENENLLKKLGTADRIIDASPAASKKVAAMFEAEDSVATKSNL
jgi:transposase-like protein